MTTTPDLAALQSPRGAALFAELEHHHDATELSIVTALRSAGYDPHLAAAAITQWRLRQRAVAKFGADAARMFFTRDGLEQATRREVANRRAAALREAGVTHLLEIGTGIGGDLTAAARAGIDVLGVEQDQATAAIAAANLAALQLPGAVETGTLALDEPGIARIRDFDAVFSDPARRAGGRRIVRADAYSPPWSYLQQLATCTDLLCLKVAPGIGHDTIAELGGAITTDWVSVAGALVEATVWRRPGAATMTHQASVLRGGEWSTLSGALTPAPLGTIGQYVYDPDPAVTTAHLVGALAHELHAHTIAERVGYLSADTAKPTPFAHCIDVVEVLPFSVKRLRSWLAAHNVGAVEIRKRGFAVTPEQLRPQLRLSGDDTMTVILTRIATGPVAIVGRSLGA